MNPQWYEHLRADALIPIIPKVTEIDPPELRLRYARERSGRTAQQVASLAGVDLASYCDMELCSDEVVTAVSLRVLKRVCDVIGITTRSLFGDGNHDPNQLISSLELLEVVRQNLRTKKVSRAQFEDDIGFEIREWLDNCESIGDWNIECLRAVCEQVGVDWLAALP